jgi:hypothetical protein
VKAVQVPVPSECDGGVAHGWRHWLVRCRQRPALREYRSMLFSGGVGVESVGGCGWWGSDILLGPEGTNHGWVLPLGFVVSGRSHLTVIPGSPVWGSCWWRCVGVGLRVV